MMYKCYRMLTLLLLLATTSLAQQVPSPKEHFGFNIGDDYKLANYTQTEAYIKKLAASGRTKLVNIGLTEEGRHQYMLIISDPENIRQLERYQQISQKLARAEGLTDEAARKLAEEGKAVVWIDGGLHANEVVATHQLIESMYQLISRNDAETKNILQNVIILMTHANPDGQEIISDWYMRESDPKKRAMNIPRPYNKYVGHDNNRDFYMMNMKESRNISRQLFIEWIPQIMYNHHQRGPAGSVLAGPPYRDPFNYVFDPLIMTTTDAVGAAMNNRLNVEGKPGYTQREGSQFSTWWNGGLRTTPYFHNMVGILTEIIGGPAPEKIPLVPERLIPKGSTPNPVTPQTWHFRQSIDYSISLNYAVLDYAARYRSSLLYNIYKMGRHAIERGSQDNWTLYPKYTKLLKATDSTKKENNEDFSFGREDTSSAKLFDAVLKNPIYRDARGYVVPADQADFLTAIKFINALSRSGIAIHKATAAFSIGNKTYPAGSYIVKTAQAFRPHVMDMFEPQDHPNDFAYAGGPPIRPYDAAGWTLAFQMGIQFDRILDNFSGPFVQLPYGQIETAPKQTLATAKAGYLLSPKINDAFRAVNDLLHAGIKVFRVSSTGTFYIPASAKAQGILQQSRVTTSSIATKPSGLKAISPMRIALYDSYGGSMPTGWTKWLFEQFNFTYDILYPKAIDSGALRKKYDMIIFTSGAIPDTGRARRGSQPKAADIPAEYRSRLGRINADTSIPQLKKFLEEGGHIVTIGTSTNLVYHLKLPVTNALTEKDRPLPSTKYYIPGSLLTADLDTTAPANYGMPAKSDVYFDRSPVFKFREGADMQKLMWFSSATPLHSGWAWGQHYLKDGIAAFVAPVGAGKLYVFGPEITFRAQAHGTFKLLFNQLYRMK